MTSSARATAWKRYGVGALDAHDRDMAPSPDCLDCTSGIWIVPTAIPLVSFVVACCHAIACPTMAKSVPLQRTRFAQSSIKSADPFPRQNAPNRQWWSPTHAECASYIACKGKECGEQMRSMTRQVLGKDVAGETVCAHADPTFPPP